MFLASSDVQISCFADYNHESSGYIKPGKNQKDRAMIRYIEDDDLWISFLIRQIDLELDREPNCQDENRFEEIADLLNKACKGGNCPNPKDRERILNEISAYYRETSRNKDGDNLRWSERE